MRAGHGHLLLRPRLQQQIIRTSGLALVVVGIILIAAGAAYFIYAEMAGSNLAQLNVSTAPPAVHNVPVTAIDASPPEDGAGIAASPVLPAPDDTSPSHETSPRISSDVVASQQLYPGTLISPNAWGDALKYEPASSAEEAFLESFSPVNPLLSPSPGTLADPTRIIISAIGVDSRVQGLQIRDLGNSLAYETPDNVVGHIPEGSNPGELGSSWYFGHLESPLAGEGNVFGSLPKIPDMLRSGEDVHAVVESSSGSFLYKLTEGLVVKPNDLSLSYANLKLQNPEFANLNPEGANLHLVTCVPKLVYDHRLVISGQLIGVRQ